MLLSFRVANHRSLRDEQQLLLTDPASDAWEEGEPCAEGTPLPVTGVFGPNASGKSNVLDALSFMARMIRWSFRESEPDSRIRRRPFALDPIHLARPSTYIVDLRIAEHRYTYGFSVDDTRVISEWLYLYRSNDREIVFERDGDDYSSETARDLIDMASVIDIAQNVLLLSVAARSRVKNEAIRSVYGWFSDRFAMKRSLDTADLRFRLSTSSKFNDELLSRLTELLSAADTGISHLEFRRSERTPEDSLLRKRERGELIFHHRGVETEHPLTLDDQSHGTLALLDIGLRALQALKHGWLLAIDELDGSLSPFLTARLIESFRDPEANPRHAQLVFTSHDTALLGHIRGTEVLRREEIWLVQKDESGCTELFPLSSYRPDEDENRMRRYLAGRYGAVPHIDDDLFAVALAIRDRNQVE
ncbi:AAA family ATPase [Marinactinospora rubrisoli]|uniref:ATP/GTP-binding protein n=1 Tax=Marinactinospora rubrisoli TaxID=2715399 RepID=A0ABW2KBH0_9ACTN